MKFEFRREPLFQLPTSVLVVYGFEGAPASSGSVERLPVETKKLLQELQSAGELTGKAYECTLIHQPAYMAAAKLLVVGAGKREKFQESDLGRLAGTAVRYLRARGIHDMAWVATGADLEPSQVEAVVDGALLADYDADRYRSERNGDRRIDGFALATDEDEVQQDAEAAVTRGRVIAEARNFTRDLVNEPSNRMTPSLLAEREQDEERTRTEWVRNRQDAETKRLTLRDQYRDLLEHREGIIAAGPDGGGPTCGRRLGDEDEAGEMDELEQRIVKLDLPPEARKEVDRELTRLRRTGRESMEAQVIRTYLEHVAELPWNTRTGSPSAADMVGTDA